MQLITVGLRPDLVMRLVVPVLLVFSGVAAARSAPSKLEPEDIAEEPVAPPPVAPPVVAVLPRADDVDHPRIEGGFGVRFGSQFLAGRDVGTVTPFHVDAGVRMPSWLLYGSYDLMSVSWPTTLAAASGPALAASATGLVQRLGGAARYAIGHVGERDLDSNVWAEVGMGLQHVTWDAGGVWTRPDLSFGIGASMFGRGNHRHGGMSAGFRVTLAHRNNASGPPSCAGPCDMATAPSGWDRSITFDLTMLFGT